MKQKNKKNPVIVIFAPTASGKTALTRDLFSPFGSHFILNAEIISADSQAVYKGMDIGTAKPSPEFCKEIPHHLINLVSPDVQFNVSDFVKYADLACKDIYSRGKIPVICGGTGFYIRNFLYGQPTTPESSEIIRAEIQNKLKENGKESLYAELQLLDSESASKIHSNDVYRICRALEIFYTTGKKRSEYILETKLREEYNFLFLILEPSREVLYKRIRERVDLMFIQGLEEEVKTLINKGYNSDSPGLNAIGYSEFFKSNDIEQIKEDIKKHSCKYAKKQFTYIRDINEGIKIPFDASENDVIKIKDLILNFVNSL